MNFKKKKGILLYTHGLGDVIILTPVLRQLYNKGYIIDLMCRKSVQTSSLLDNCPYINKLIIVPNPWQSPLGFGDQTNKNLNQLKKIKSSYDWVGKALHAQKISDKITYNFKETNLPCNDLRLEVFIPPKIEKEAMKYIKNNYPNGYIFNHTTIEFHPAHTWNSINWIKNNLPDLPVIDTGKGGNYYMKFGDINFSFVLAREANYRVLSSSVFVHACEAMNVDMEIINYGRPDRKVWPHNQHLVKRIRENNKWIKTYNDEKISA